MFISIGMMLLLTYNGEAERLSPGRITSLEEWALLKELDIYGEHEVSDAPCTCAGR